MNPNHERMLKATFPYEDPSLRSLPGDRRPNFQSGWLAFGVKDIALGFRFWWLFYRGTASELQGHCRVMPVSPGGSQNTLLKGSMLEYTRVFVL